MGATVFHGQTRAICITDKYTRAVKICCYTLIFFEIPDSILLDTALGYAGVWAPEQQVCLENPEVKTICVWFHS